MFDFDFSKAPEGTGAKKEFEPLPTGEYKGTIDSAEVKSGKSGRYINVKLKLDNKRVVFDRLNFESQNQTAKEIATKKFQSIVFFGINSPVSKFKSLDEMASYIQGTPIHIYYVNKGKNEAGYDMSSISYKNGVTKITKTAQPVKASSVY